MEKTIAIITLLTALTIAGVAGWFSIIGIMAIFAGAAIPAAIMGASLEVGKLVTAVWLKINWNKTAVSLKSYLTAAVLVLMFITSMGIFGFLSKAHIEQGAPVADNAAKIERIDQKIERQESKITDSQKVIDQLDEQVNTLIEYDKISGPDGSRAVRNNQEPQRQELRTRIAESENQIDVLLDQKFQLQQEVRQFEVEVGPIKYIAELIYDDPKSNLDSAVRMVIIVFIFVFDPLAVLLLLAANQTLIELSNEKKGSKGTGKNFPSNKMPSGPISSNNLSKEKTGRNKTSNRGQGSIQDSQKNKKQRDSNVDRSRSLYKNKGFHRHQTNNIEESEGSNSETSGKPETLQTNVENRETRSPDSNNKRDQERDNKKKKDEAPKIKDDVEPEKNSLQHMRVEKIQK